MLTISATKPRAKVANMLRESGATIVPIKEDEGNVDRYVISKRLVIERRTGGSFLKGIMEKTLFTSAIYMREHFQLPVLVLEGKVNYEYSMMNPQAVRGALSSMMIQYGLNVLATTDIEDTVELITMMARQEQVGIPEISLIPKRKATSVDDMQRRLIEMLPGCGMVMARELLQYFGSVQAIVTAAPEELHSMRGIGAKKAAEMYNVLNAEYEAVDTEKNLEDAIEAQPSLLFKKSQQILERQHYIYTDDKERHIVDMVAVDKKAGEVILVELKRGALTRDACDQISRYMDNAHKSKTLKGYLDKGMKLRGLLATVEPCEINTRRDVTVKIVDRKKAAKVLVKMRKQRPGRSAG